jgi:hypothetical protein
MATLQLTVPPRDTCVVLVPVGHHIEPACEAALIELEKRGYAVWRIRGYAAIDQARNQMATDALAQGYTETMWIDSDIAFDPSDVDRLRCLELPLVCGIYPMKGKRELAAHVLPGTRELNFGNRGGLVELKYAATGFLHVRREVYEMIERELYLPRCNMQFGGNGMVPYFQPLVVGGVGNENGEARISPAKRPLPQNSAMQITRVFPSPNVATDLPEAPWYLAEDYAFCERARRCGFAIWADTRIRLRHIGSYEYTWEEAGTETKRFATFTYHLGAPTETTDGPRSAGTVEAIGLESDGALADRDVPVLRACEPAVRIDDLGT